MRYPLVAFCGFARTGKDEAAKVLIESGYNRVAFGDIIKAQVNSLVEYHFGFSAHTEKTDEKAKIRRTLESWGEDNYENVFDTFFARLTPPAVNVRLCRVKEAAEWVRRGGIIVNVTRPGVGAETPWSGEVNAVLRASGLVHSELSNCGSVEDLRAAVKGLYL